ncbi:MAG: hypothetical protein ACO3F5_02355 [Gemmatimonadaceae bacterium]
MLRRVVVLLLTLLAADATAQAVTVTLTVTNADALMQDATLDDYANGYIIGVTPVSYTVTLAGSQSVCATVQLRGAAAAGSDHGLSDVQWGLTAASQPMTLTTAAADVSSHHLTNSSRTDTGVIYLRKSNLAWSDGPKTYLGPDLIFDVSARRASAC